MMNSVIVPKEIEESWFMCDAALLAMLHQVLIFVTSGVFCLSTQENVTSG
jgi:hypothetical protein